MKKLRLNVVVAFITKLLHIFSGIILQRFVLKSFGPEIDGLTGSITQFMSYFTLLEAGLGLASIQALYKPLANDDKNKIQGILSATSIQYRKIGATFLLLTIILSFIMPFITHSDLNSTIIIILTMIMGLGSVINYFFIGKYQVLLNADRRVYVLNILDSVLGLSFQIIKIILINIGWNVIWVYAIGLLSPLVRIFVLRIYFLKHYPYLSHKENNIKPDFAALGKRKFVLVHQVVGMITTHTDVTLLTILSPLSNVSIYNVYNYIYNNIKNIFTSTLYSAVAPSFGRLVGSKSKKVNTYFKYYELLLTFFLSWLFSSVLLMTIPFVKLYTSGIPDIEYVDSILAVLFMIATYFSLVRIPAIMMINITGAFKETQKGAIIEAVLNVAISIPAFFIMGIKGLLVGTCISMFYRLIDVEKYVYHNIINVKLSNWIKLFLVNLISVVAFVIGYYYLMSYEIVTWVQWLLSGIICALVSAIYFVIIFCAFYNRDFSEIIHSIKNKIKKNKIKNI